MKSEIVHVSFAKGEPFAKFNLEKPETLADLSEVCKKRGIDEKAIVNSFFNNHKVMARIPVKAAQRKRLEGKLAGLTDAEAQVIVDKWQPSVRTVGTTGKMAAAKARLLEGVKAKEPEALACHKAMQTAGAALDLAEATKLLRAYGEKFVKAE